MTPKSLAKLAAAWPRGRRVFSEALFNVMLDEGLCGGDYDDQIDGARAAGLIAGNARDQQDAIEGARAFHEHVEFPRWLNGRTPSPWEAPSMTDTELAKIENYTARVKREGRERDTELTRDALLDSLRDVAAALRETRAALTHIAHMPHGAAENPAVRVAQDALDRLCR